MPGFRAFRPAKPVATVCVFVLLLFGVLAPGEAFASGFTITPTNPVAGDPVTIVGSYTMECYSGISNNAPQITFTLKILGSDGTTYSTVQTSGNLGNNDQWMTTIAKAGTYEVTEDFVCPNNYSPGPQDFPSTSDPFTVGQSLSVSLSTDPTTVVVNQPVTISGTPNGGTAPYSYAWDLTNSGTFTPASPSTNSSITTTFTTVGIHTVKLQIQDTANSGNLQHTYVATDDVNVVAASTGTPPPPPPPTCYTVLNFQLVHFTTTGCFTQSTTDPNVYTTRSDIKFNGATLTGYGQTFTITEPTSSDPGGHFTAPNSTIAIGGVVVFSGNIDWSLPQGGPGSQALAESFTVATGYSFLNLTVSGTVSLTLGEDSSGNYYSDYGLNLQLPAGFSAGPNPSFGGVTGAAAVKVDDSGVHYGGIQLAVQNIWMGSLQVESACFAYIPAGGNQANQCAAPTPTGGTAPIVSCNTNPDASYWGASVVVDLPSGLQLSAFGSLVGDQVGSFGGSVGNLGTRVPIATGVYLDHVAFGMCLAPPPLVISAQAGINFLGSSHIVSITGGFTYTDSTDTTPWSLQVNGSLQIGDTPIGQATLGIDGNAVINFEVQAGFTALDNIASLNGDIYGWIDAPEKEFVVGGDVKGCFGGVCAGASGEFSSTGVAGCVTVGTTSPTYDLIIPLDGGAPYLDRTVYPVTAGFGYDWGASSVDLLGGSCDFSNYEPADAFSARAANGTTRLTTKVAEGTEAVALRIHGSHGAPQIVIHGPNGVKITSPAHGIASRLPGHYMLIENKTDATADVVLLRPAAGTWTVNQEPGSASAVTKMDRASLETPPTFGAHVSGKGARRVIQVAYAVPTGATVRLVEHAKGVQQMLARHLSGHRCPGLPVLRPHTDERILCTSVRFTPALGQTRKRQVEAVVLRRGIPLAQKTIATYTAPPPQLPSRPVAMRIQRGSGSLLVSFARSTYASHYAVSAKLSDGRELAYYIGATCHALKIANVPASVGGAIKIAGVRLDMRMGKSKTLAINPNSKSAGKKSKRITRGKVCS